MRTLRIGFDMFSCPLTGNAETSFNTLNDTEKTAFVQKVLEARYTFTRDGEDGKQAKDFLSNNFGEKFAEMPGFKGGERLMYSFDRSGTVFRCWFSSFGNVSRFSFNSEVMHFDSCGKGLLFHAQCEDPEAFRRFIKTLTDRMVRWESDYGQLWAGWPG